MRLAKGNFFRNELSIIVRGEKIPIARYGYETSKAIYDVDILSAPISDNGKTYTRLYGKNQRYMAHPEQIHKAIEAHFSL